MKYLKKYESLESIESICKRYNIKNYTINSDGSIDVDDDVYLSNKSLTKLPLKFNRVSGIFDCSNNKLTTLEGSPREVGGWFNCSYNSLTTLEGSPREIGLSFYCSNNSLKSLEFGPEKVGGKLLLQR